MTPLGVLGCVMPLGPFQSLVQKDFEAMKALIDEVTSAPDASIENMLTHHFESGGKRLRPLIVLLSSHACQYQGKHHIYLAALVEILHSASLLHDDVIDDAPLRRGKKTAHRIWGKTQSILGGDYLYTKYLQLMLRIGNYEIIQFMNEIADHITRGEIKQLQHRRRDDLSEHDYFQIIHSKTALLFGASSALGAYISNQSPEIINNLNQYGIHLGNTFQLIDDALDYASTTETIGKRIGTDLECGLPTLPLLYAIEHTSEDKKLMIQSSLRQGTLADIADMVNDVINETEALTYTQNIAQNEADKALTCLYVLKDSVYKTALEELVNYALNRKN